MTLANVGAANLTNATAIGNGATVSASNTIQLGNTNVTLVNTTGAITSGAIVTGASFTGAGTGLTGTADSLTAGSVTTNANLTGDVTSSGNETTLDSSGVTIGTYTKVTVDAKGRVTIGSAIDSADVTTALGYTPSLVREVADEDSATAAQTSFTLTQTPSANSKVKMYINGVRISNSAYSVSEATLTYDPAKNGAYALEVNDRIQFDYYY